MNGSGLPRVLYLALEAPREGVASYAHVNEIINGLRRLGHEVILFAPRYTDGDAKPNVVGRLLEYVRLQWHLIKTSRRGDVIYVRSHFLAALVSAYARPAGIPIVQEINGPYEDLFISYPWTRYLGRHLIRLQRWQFRSADVLIPVTQQLKDWVIGQIGAADVEVVPNGANTDLFRPDAPLSVDALPEKFVVFFGGFARWQGLETLIDSVDSAAWPADTQLVIVGDGAQRDLVAQAAARNPRLKWLGRLDYAKVAGVVSRSIAGLVPKNRQGDRDETGLFPIKLFETLACGVPAIVTDFPGQADLIRAHDCGLVIPAENSTALAEAAARLAADPGLAREMGARGAELIRREHSWQRRAEQTAAVIARVAWKQYKMQPEVTGEKRSAFVLPNRDDATIADFGREWTRYDQNAVTDVEMREFFASYFSIFPWNALPVGAIGFDAGCGSGRWAALVAPRVGRLHCIDASADALRVARQRLSAAGNATFHHASIDALPFDDASMDFGYSLGVLHHMPDTQAGLDACVRMLKPGAPFLLYIYYAFDNRPAWFRALWRASDIMRRRISKMPFRMKSAVTETIAALVYWPLARAALIAERFGARVDAFPLSAYRTRSFYSMRTDALDRFGTRLEHRYTAAEIRVMMEKADLESIQFSQAVPYWCAVGRRVRTRET